MTWSLHTAPALASRLQASQQGLLIAVVDNLNQTVTVLGSVPVASGGFRDVADAVLPLIPTGLHIVGSYASSSSSGGNWQPTASQLPVVSVDTSSSGEAAWSVNGQPTTATEAACPAAAGAEDAGLHILAGFVPLRCHLEVQLNIQYTTRATSSSAVANANSSSSPPPVAAIQVAVQQLQEGLLTQQLAFISEERAAAEGQPQQPAVLITTTSSSSSVQEALGGSSSSGPSISLLPLQSSSGSGDAAKPSAPMFEYTPADQQQQVTCVTAGLDVLCYAPGSMQLRDLQQSLLLPALQQQLATVQQVLQQQAAEGQALVPVRAYHFQPPGLGFPVTVCYPMLHQSLETTELKLLARRQELHRLLGLPDNVPMLRFANALDWSSNAGEAPGVPRSLRLRNVHEGLAPPGFGGQLYLIGGAYEYYHYMQDKFNDNGWGCAYRSLQTIISWFRLQKYTGKPVPAHRQIQEILVSLGDKEASFTGSSNWIGAIELSYILDEYLGITSKVLTVNRGDEIPANARALAQHFTSQGTPVMIGGGVLAYTLLGVAFNKDTGEAAFLILDPHYTGGEDLKKIWQGTWVAWKQLGDNAAAGGPLFVKDAFYNFLCPQRPRTV